MRKITMTNKLPLNWCECKFGDVCYLQNGYAFNSKEYADSGINLIRISDIKDDKVITDNCVKVCDNIDSCFRVNKGDFLLAMSGATTGKTGVYLYDNYALLNQRVGNLKIYSENLLNPLYRNYFIMNKRREIEKKAYGGAQPNISKQLIEDLNLLLPPLAEQGRIVDRIEEIFAKIDAGVEKLKSAQEKIKQYKQSVLHSAFTGKLEKVSNWKHAFLKEICNKITDGSHFSPESDNSYDYPYITVKDIFNDNIMFSSAKKIKKIDYEKLVYNGCKPNIGDVLFSKDGTVGKVSLIQSNINFVVLSSLAILTPNYDKITSKFLFYMLKSPEFLSEALKNKTGVAIRRIILATLKNIKVFYPSDISEQERIVEEIEKRFAKADKMLEVVEKSLKSAEQLKQSVLKKAFEGKLVPQDPNDESASVLLARIKTEKQQNEKVKGKRK